MREKLRTLMIEDSPTCAQQTKDMLAECPYFDHEFVIAPTLAGGKAKLGSQMFDLILLDLILPNGKGVAAVKDVREMAPQTPLVVVTTIDNRRTNTDDEKDVMESLADAYVIKGRYNAETFRRIICGAIFARRGIAEAAKRSAVMAAKEATSESKRRLEAMEKNPSLPPFKDCDKA